MDKRIMDELCICGHSKKSHGMTNLDNHGGECNQCKCNIYTWGEFIFCPKCEVIKKMKVKERIEKLHKEFRVNKSIKHEWDVNNFVEPFPKWWVLMFGKYCYLKGKRKNV